MSRYAKIDKHIAEGNANSVLAARAMYEHGTRTSLPSFYRYVVLDVVFDPQIVDEAKIDYWTHRTGISNPEWAASPPRNAIIAQRVYEGAQQPPMILYPFFPSHFAFPCKPGEHVWVMFESPNIQENDIGYWFCKITEQGHVDDVNHTHAPRAYDPTFLPGTKDIYEDAVDPVYEFRNGRPEEDENGERFVNPETSVLPSDDETVYEKLLTDTDAAQLMTYEAVPRYRKRPGDLAIEGTNNTLVVLGVDRTGAASDTTKVDDMSGVMPAKIPADLDGSAGMIDIVAGRGQTEDTLGKEVTSKRIDKSDFNKELGKSGAELVEREGDPDFKNDRSRIMVSQRTNVDKNFGTDKLNSMASTSGGFGVTDSSTGDAAIVIKTDKLRLIARSDVEIVVTGYTTANVAGQQERKDENDDTSMWASIIIKSNGDIVFRPSDKGYIKLGDDSADRALLCTDAPATFAEGKVDAKTAALTTTMGGAFGGTGISTQGTWAKKILVTGAK